MFRDEPIELKIVNDFNKLKISIRLRSLLFTKNNIKNTYTTQYKDYPKYKINCIIHNVIYKLMTYNVYFI